MINWRTSIDRQDHQQRVNKAVRTMNKNLQEDKIWQGRFEIRLIYSDFYVYEDESGGNMICYFEIVDKLTRKARMVRIEESNFFDSDIWYEVNDFICNDIVAPLKYEGDFTKVKIPMHSMRFWRNHWHQVVEV